jgi:hypothetical protein
VIRSYGFLTGIRGGEHPVRGVRRVCGGAGPPVCNSPGSPKSVHINAAKTTAELHETPSSHKLRPVLAQ